MTNQIGRAGQHPDRGAGQRDHARDHRRRRLQRLRGGHARERRGAPPGAGGRAGAGRPGAAADDADLGSRQPAPDESRDDRKDRLHGRIGGRVPRPTKPAPPRAKKGEASADYVEIRSTVTWPSIGSRAPVVAQSLVAPPNGSISANSGSLGDPDRKCRKRRHRRSRADRHRRGHLLRRTPATTAARSSAICQKGQLHADALRPTRWSTKTARRRNRSKTSVVEESTNTLVLQYDKPGEVDGQLRDHGRR